MVKASGKILAEKVKAAADAARAIADHRPEHDAAYYAKLREEAERIHKDKLAVK